MTPSVTAGYRDLWPLQQHLLLEPEPCRASIQAALRAVRTHASCTMQWQRTVGNLNSLEASLLQSAGSRRQQLSQRLCISAAIMWQIGQQAIANSIMPGQDPSQHGHQLAQLLQHMQVIKKPAGLGSGRIVKPASKRAVHQASYLEIVCR